MVGFSPPPPPQAARAFVRQLFSPGGGRPRVVATLLDDPGSRVTSLEFLNEGGRANGVECLAEVGGRTQHRAVGSLARGEAKSIVLEPIAPGDCRGGGTCWDGRRVLRV